MGGNCLGMVALVAILRFTILPGISNKWLFQIMEREIKELTKDDLLNCLLTPEVKTKDQKYAFRAQNSLVIIINY